MEDNWTPPSDAEVTDWTPPSDAQVIDEPVKKKVTPSPSPTQSSSNVLNLLSGVIPSGKALLTGQKEESAPTEQKQIDLTNAPIAEDESTRTDKFIRKPIDKKKVDEIYTLSKQNESLVDEFAKLYFVLDNLSQTEAIKQLNDLYAKREQAKDPQTAQAIDNQIEVIKSQPVEKQPSIQEAVLQNAQKYGSQPQDFNRPEIPMNPLTPNQILERNGMKTANTVGELHDRYIESATKLNELRPELDKTAAELDAFKKDARTADFKTDKSGNKTLEGLADIPEAFGHGFGGTMKSIEQGFVNLLGDKQDRIDYAKKRYLEDNILYPTRTKGMATSGSEMIGGVAPYVISTAVLPETALLGHIITNGLTMGVSGYGNGYYEMFAKQKQQGVSDEEADAIAMQNAKFEGAKETAIGASLPFMGGAGSKLFLAPAEKSAMKQFLATQGVIIPTFTAGKLASNVYQKYGLGEKDVNLGDGLAETAENGLILGAMMEFAHKAPTKLKELYRANLSEQYPSIQQSVDKAVKDGVMDASQGYAFTEKLKRDFAVFNAMPKGITTEQKLAIEPEVKQIIELSSREPSAVESPEVTKDKIVQLQKQVAEKLGTPLTEKEMKSYEKLQEIKGDKEDKLTPSEKAELNHYEKRIETAKENEVKLAEEKKVAEAEIPTTNVGVEEGSGGVGGDVESTAKALEGVDTQSLKKQLGIEANWDMIGEGDALSGKDPVLAYTQKRLPDWNRENQKGNINPNSKITYDIVRGKYGGIDQKDIVVAKDENGVTIGIVKLDDKGGIKHIAVAPEFRGKGVADKLIQTLKENNPQLDLSKTKLRSKGFEKAFGNKIISEAYHKAKADGTNPELVKAVEQSLKETTKAESNVEEGSGGVEGDVGLNDTVETIKEIKTAIDNGEVTREQADDYIKNNDGAKSESTIEDIERKAESENEAELNEAIDQADKLIGEAVTRSEGKTESSNEKVEGGEVKKTVLTKRLYEGKIRESVKSALEEYGLTREVENQSITEKKGKQFVEEFGEDVSLDAIKNGDIKGGVAAVVLDEVAKSLERKMLTENDPVKMAELVAKQAEVINVLETIAMQGGQFNAMLKKVYQNSDLGYNYETKVSEWKAENSGFIPKEVEARFKELDTQMKDLRKRIAETELKLREAEERQAFDNIVAEVRQKPKTERSGKRKIAEGLDELTNALGVKLSAVGDKKASATKALIKIGEGLIEEGIATAKNVAEKIREYVEDKFKGKIDIKEYEPDVLKHFEETLPKITERNGKIHIPDKLIKELVRNGAETIEDLVSQVKEIAKADFPDITDREIRNSIVEYGKTQEPTKNDLLLKISRMKRIGRLISQLEDVRSGIRPLKSGLQRDEIQPRERELNKQLKEEMRNLPMDEETLAGQIRTVLDARTKGIENRIEDLQREIDKGEKIPKNQRTIEDNQKVKDLREQLEKVKAEHQEKFAEQNEAEKEAKRLSMAKKNTQNRIEELSKRLREGDFSKIEKKRLEPDLELSKLRFEKEKIQHEYDKEFEKDRLLKRTKMEKFGDFALEAWGMSRILKATADLSFIYIQGKYALTHPKIASKAFVQSMKLFASEKRAEKFIEDIRTSELYPTMKDSKLSIPEPNAKINASEELSYSGWLNSTWKAIGYPLKYVSENAYENWDKVNPSKAFERASIGYLNTVRVLRFSDGVKMLELRGQTLENSPKEYKNMADFVNTFTGRASLGSLEQQSEMLARVFFSPRNWASVFKQSILLPRQMYKWREAGDEYTFSVAQKMAFRDVSAWVGLSTTMATLAGAVLNNDDDKKTGVEKDIRSTDFAKIKLGDTRVDPFGGYLSPIIMASRIAMDITHEIAPKYSDGGYKNKDGKIVPLGKGYVPTKKELLEQVAINKLNPSTSALYSYLAKKEKNGEWVNEYGKPYDFKEDLKLYPMMADMIMEIYLEDPTALNGLLTFGAYFGLPVSKYGEDTDAQRKKKELEKKKD